MNISVLVNKAKMSFKKYSQIPFNLLSKKSLYYIVEPADWVIKDVGLNITKNLKDVSCRVTTTQHGIRSSIIHYGSKYTFFKKNKMSLPHKSNKIIVTWYHVSPEDKELVKLIPFAIEFVDIWHTACNLTKEKLLSLGIPKEKIRVIPLGVNLKIFKRPTESEKKNLREMLGLPKDKIIIGSFQKDGVGWGKGLEPKFIKGPDIFCDVVESLSKNYDIFVLLAGPSRGYVKNRLRRANIPYLHRYFRNPEDVSLYYKVIDLYLVTSREEGGPQAILESMASGVPLVTTKVGMAADIVRQQENGFIVEVEQTAQIIERASKLIEDKDLRGKFILNGIESVKSYDWPNIAKEYQNKILKTLENEKLV